MNINGITALPGAFAGAVNLIQIPENISGIVDTSYMLSGATSYNGDEIETWDFTDTVNMSGMLDDCGLEPEKYNSFIMTLADWVTETGASGRVLGAANVWWGDVELSGYTYSGVVDAREYLESGGWTLTNDKEAQVIVINTALGTGTDIDLSYRSNVTGSVLDCIIYWGDGVSEQYSGAGISTNQTHDYGADGEYTIHVVGTATHSDGNGFGYGITENRKKLIQVRSFGDVGTYSHFSFQFSPNIEYVPKYLPSTVMRIPGFRGNGIIDTWKIENVALWDVSNINADGAYIYAASEVFGATGVTDTLILNWSFDYPVIMWEFYRDINNNNIIVSNIDFSNVRNLWRAFSNNNQFDQPFLNTDFRNCDGFERTFLNASSFNQNLGSWQLRTAGVNMAGMLDNCGMDVENYSRTMIGWANYVYANSGLPDDTKLGALNLVYNDVDYLTSGQFTNAKDAHDYLISGANWTIAGDSIEEIPGAMYMQFDTSLISGSTIELPLAGTVDCTIYWGDTNDTVATSGDLYSHTYSADGDYLVAISGDLTGFGNGAEWSGVESLTKVYTFGDTGMAVLDGAFRGATNLTQIPVNVSGITDISYMLSGATSYNGDELTTWNMSGLTNASGALDNCGMLPENYSQLLINFANSVYNSEMPTGIVFGAAEMWRDTVDYEISGEFSTAADAHEYLTSSGSWSIVDDKRTMDMLIDTELHTSKEISLPFRGNFDVVIDWGDGSEYVEYSGYYAASRLNYYIYEYQNSGQYHIRVWGYTEGLGKAFKKDDDFGGWLGGQMLYDIPQQGDLGTYDYGCFMRNEPSINSQYRSWVDNWDMTNVTNINRWWADPEHDYGRWHFMADSNIIYTDTFNHGHITPNLDMQSATLVGWANNTYRNPPPRARNWGLANPSNSSYNLWWVYDDTDWSSRHSGEFQTGKQAFDYLTTPLVESGAGWTLVNTWYYEDCIRLTFDTNKSSGKTISLPVRGLVSIQIFWGDDTANQYRNTYSSNISHTYAEEGIYTVTIIGTIPQFGAGITWTGVDKLLTVDILSAETTTTLFSGAFIGATNLSGLPEDVDWVTDVSYMLSGATTYSGVELATWDVTIWTNAEHVLDNTAIDISGYDYILSGWSDMVDTSGAMQEITVGVDGLVYSATGSGYVDTLESYGWVFSGHSQEVV